MYLNSSTCIYLSHAIDDGVPMTSKRLEKIQFHMFFFLSFFFLSFAFFSVGKLGTCLRSCCSCIVSQKKSATLQQSWDADGCALLCQHSFLKPGFHIVVSVVSVVRKKFIGQIEFILTRTTSCICRFFCVSICTGGFHKVISVL